MKMRSLTRFLAASFIVSISLLAAASCAPRMNLVAKATSYATYYKASYAEKCHSGPANSSSCLACQHVIEIGEKRVAVANQTYKLGYMAPQQTKELEQLIVDLQACP